MIKIRPDSGIRGKGTITEFSTINGHEIQKEDGEKVGFKIVSPCLLGFTWKSIRFEYDLKTYQLVEPASDSFRSIGFSLLKYKGQKKGILVATTVHISDQEPNYYKLVGEIDTVIEPMVCFEIE